VTKLAYRILIVFLLLLLNGCVTDSPAPVELYQPADSFRSCDDLKWQILANQKLILKRVPKQNKLGQNIAAGVVGTVLVIPWFFMDFSESERVEIEGLQQRNQWLMNLAAHHQCDNMPPMLRFIDIPGEPIRVRP
jgi:hypothetical protein